MRTLPKVILYSLLVCGPELWAQDSPSKRELQQLKSLVTAQQKALEQQQKTLEQQQIQIQRPVILAVDPGEKRYPPLARGYRRDAGDRYELRRRSARSD